MFYEFDFLLNTVLLNLILNIHDFFYIFQKKYLYGINYNNFLNLILI